MIPKDVGGITVTAGEEDLISNQTFLQQNCIQQSWVFLQVPEHIVLLLFARHCNLVLFWS